jgi:hypothetical protein
MTTRTLGQKQEAAARAAAVAAKEKEAAARAAKVKEAARATKEKEAADHAAKTKEHSAPGPSTGNTNSPGGKQARKSTTPRQSPRGSPAAKVQHKTLQTESLRQSPRGSQGSTKSPPRSNKRAKVTASTNGDPNDVNVNAAVLNERDGVDAVYAGVLAEVRPEVPALVEGSTKVRALDKDSSKESSGTAEENDESSDDQNDDFAEPSRVHKKKTATANADGPKDDQSSTDDDEILPTPVKKASDIDRAKRGRKFKTDSPAGLL